MSRVMIAGVAAGLVLLAPTSKAQENNPGGTILPEHKVLAMGEGVWDADVTLTLQGPDSKPTVSKSKGVETNRLLAGRWLISDFKGELFGRPFEGNGQNGYDPMKGKYIATWVGSTSNRIMMLEGSYDEKTRTLMLHGSAEGPDSGKTVRIRLETRYQDADTRIFTEYIQPDGAKDYTKVMEVRYTKRKK